MTSKIAIHWGAHASRVFVEASRLNARATIISSFFILLSSFCLGAQTYKLNFTPSPAESTNFVAQYIAVWSYTNAPYTNTWSPFATTPAPAGTVTNFIINSLVPPVAWLAVEVQGTNGLISAPTNRVMYNAASLAGIYTNVPIAPASPGPPALSN